MCGVYRILRFHRRDSSLEIRAKIMRDKMSPSIIFAGVDVPPSKFGVELRQMGEGRDLNCGEN